jgi:4,5-dihydroxyphthalate decarboxylase
MKQPHSERREEGEGETMSARDKMEQQVPGQQAGKDLFPVSMALAQYDRTQPIIDGRVRPEGLALKINTGWIGDFCIRPVYEEYDVAEMSLSWYVAARLRGDPVVALPVFPLRMPVHAYMFCRADAPYTKPQDLIGKRIGTLGYRYTVNLWIRGILKEHYGVTPDQYDWVTSEPEGAGYVIPPGVNFKIVTDRKPEELLKSGEVDALFVPEIPEAFQRVEPWIRRLFPECRAELEQYARKTGFVPVTHTIVMKQALAEREPWVAERLLRAFTEAQRVCDDYWHSDPKHLSLPGGIFALERERAAYGPNPYAQGVAANRKVIETFVGYAHDQGYIKRIPRIEELFVPNTLSS